MKPLALDLCCGKGGWTIGLQAAGWEVIGFDIEAWPGYPGDKLIVGDVREVDGTLFKHASLVCASPPCQEFSYRHLPFGRVKNLPPPDRSIWEACIRIAKEAEAPLILENVVGAQPFMGKATRHYGSYYLWGDLPALLPAGKPERKALIPNGSKRCTEISEIEKHSYRFGSKSTERKEWSAKAAMIPFELAHWIGECFYPQEVQ